MFLLKNKLLIYLHRIRYLKWYLKYGVTPSYFDENIRFAWTVLNQWEKMISTSPEDQKRIDGLKHFFSSTTEAGFYELYIPFYKSLDKNNQGMFEPLFYFAEYTKKQLAKSVRLEKDVLLMDDI